MRILYTGVCHTDAYTLSGADSEGKVRPWQCDLCNSLPHATASRTNVIPRTHARPGFPYALLTSCTSCLPR